MLAVAIVALLAFAWRPAFAPIAPPPPTAFPRELVATRRDAGERRQLHRLPHQAGRPGQCRRPGDPHAYRQLLLDQHHARSRRPASAPGRKAAFTRALREGVSRDGRHLFPVFPYTHYTQLDRRRHPRPLRLLHDAAAGEGAEPAQQLSFPADIRPLLALWKILFFKPGPYRPDPGHDARWNRGAYLAEAVAACADCHTDRNAFGAEQVGHPYAGAHDRWLVRRRRSTSAPRPRAGPRTSCSPSAPRREPAARRRRSGRCARVVRGLAKLPDDDLQAMATYFVSLNTPVRRGRSSRRSRARPRPVPPDTDRSRSGRSALPRALRQLPWRAGQPADRRALAARPERGAVEPLPALQLAARHPRRHRRQAMACPAACPAFRDKLSDRRAGGTRDLSAGRPHHHAAVGPDRAIWYARPATIRCRCAEISSKIAACCCAAFSFALGLAALAGTASAQTMEFGCPKPGTTFMFDSGTSMVARSQEGMDCIMQFVGGSTFKVRAPAVRQSRARRQRHLGLHRRGQAGAAVAARGRQEDRGLLQRRRPQLELHPDRRPLREAPGPGRRAVRRLRHRDERAGRQGPALGLALVGVAGREVRAALRLEQRRRQAPTAPSSQHQALD